MSTNNTNHREGLRGLGEELVRLAFRAPGGALHREHPLPFRAPDGVLPWGVILPSWSDLISSIVADADRDLHDALHPYNDLALLESHGEQLLDFVIRLASKQQWTQWLILSMKNVASTGATDVFLQLFTCRVDVLYVEHLTRLLEQAAGGGSVEILSALIAAGGGPLIRAVDEVDAIITTLHIAAGCGHRRFVAKLVEAGAPVEARNILGATALTEAVEGGRKGVVLELLASGADVNNIVDSTYYHRIGSPVPNGHGFPFPYSGLTPLSIAVDKNDEEKVKLLLEAGAEPDTGPKDGKPIYMAASRGHYEILISLLLAGASVSSVDTEGRSALHLACAHNQHDAVSLLLRYNSSVATLCNGGLSPMDAVGTQVLALRQDGPKYDEHDFIPSTLNSVETSTVDSICDMLQSSSAWGRRGWLVLMRSRPLAEVDEPIGHSHADEITGSVRDMSLIRVPSSNTTTSLPEEGGTATILQDDGHARTDWRAAVVRLLQGPDETLFRSILRYL